MFVLSNFICIQIYLYVQGINTVDLCEKKRIGSLYNQSNIDPVVMNRSESLTQNHYAQARVSVIHRGPLREDGTYTIFFSTARTGTHRSRTMIFTSSISTSPRSLSGLAISLLYKMSPRQPHGRKLSVSTATAGIITEEPM